MNLLREPKPPLIVGSVTDLDVFGCALVNGCPYRDIPKAVKVPANQSEIVPSSAFLLFRHVSIETIRAVGAQAWQSCRLSDCQDAEHCRAY